MKVQTQTEETSPCRRTQVHSVTMGASSKRIILTLPLLAANLRDHLGDGLRVHLLSFPSFPADSDLPEVSAKGLQKRSGTV